VNYRRVLHLFFKELRDTVRDSRSLLLMVAFPVFVYPLLFVTVSQLLSHETQRLERSVSRIAIMGDAPAGLAQTLVDARGIEIVPVTDPQQALSMGEVDAVIRIAPGFQRAVNQGGTGRIEIFFDATELESRQARERLSDVVVAYDKNVLELRLTGAGLDHAFIKPVLAEYENVASPAKTAGTILGLLLPTLVIIGISLGAFYPALDMTVGERERGTFETLFSAPVSPAEVLTGKFLCVWLFSLVTGALNLGGLALTIATNRIVFPDALLDGELLLPWRAAAAALLALLPLTVLTAAGVLTLSVLARTFKQAQSLVAPFYLALFVPAMLGSLPTVKLTSITALVPVMNCTLLFRAFLTGSPAPSDLAATVISTSLFAVAALLAAIRLFSNEELILSPALGLRMIWRRPAHAGSLGPLHAVLVLVCACLAMFYLSGPLVRWRFLAGYSLFQAIGILLPAVFIIRYFRLPWRAAGVRRPNLVHLAAAPLLVPGLLGAARWIAEWQHSWISFPPEALVELEQLFGSISGNPLAFLSLAVLPAVAEELMFRGIIFHGCRVRLPVVPAVVVQAVLFGMFHFSLPRFLPSALSGLVLGGLTAASGSIWPAMIAHAAVNGLSLAEHFPPLTWGTGLLFAAGAGLCLWPRYRFLSWKR